MKILNFTDKDINELKSRDRRLAVVINGLIVNREGTEDIFASIIHSIVSQQVSRKVADLIFDRLTSLASGIDAQSIYNLSVDSIKSAGMSQRKAEYIRSVACAVIEKRLLIDKLPLMDDEDVIKELVKLDGIGRWTAEMLLIFCLKRADILPVSDLGIRRGIESYILTLRKSTMKP